MPEQSTTSRALHDLGLAAWFGGSLMGAVGLNGATGSISDPLEAGHVANVGWGRWTPVNAAAIAAHLVGGTGLIAGNKGRLAVQRGAAGLNATKAALTVAGLVATGYSGVLQRQLRQAEKTSGMPAASATEPTAQTPPRAASAQRKQAVLQWLIPALTGGLLVLNAKAGEQQRPATVVRGLWERLVG